VHAEVVERGATQPGRDLGEPDELGGPAEHGGRYAAVGLATAQPVPCRLACGGGSGCLQRPGGGCSGVAERKAELASRVACPLGMVRLRDDSAQPP
jgi:hypothetical protein